MRWLLIREAEDGIALYVVGEIIDEWLAKDSIHFGGGIVAMSEQEAHLDPDFGAAAEAWDAGDDSTYASWMGIENAEIAIDDAECEMRRAEAATEPEPEPFAVLPGRTVYPLAEQELIERYYETCQEAWKWLFAIEREHGVEDAATIARMLARGFGHYSTKMTGVKTL